MSEEEKEAIEFIQKRQDFMKSEPRCVGDLENNIDIILSLIEKQKNKIASQKKQIKLMQSCDLAKEISKQQKEIEELKEENKQYKIQEDLTFKCLEKTKYMSNYISKDKVRKKTEEQLKEADDVLINKNYIDNFNGNKEQQKYYFDGYKDATLFLQELLEERN